jgi:hypothetical protein
MRTPKIMSIPILIEMCWSVAGYTQLLWLKVLSEFQSLAGFWQAVAYSFGWHLCYVSWYLLERDPF